MLRKFVDGTFSSTPGQFHQCLIVMVFDEIYDCYLPCYYALLSGKTESCYRTFYRMLAEDLNHKCDPSTIGVDFEQGLINATKQCFPEAKLIGCHFHFKQAIRKYMVGLKIPSAVIEWFMKPGNLDLLTVLPKEDIRSINARGVLYVAMLCDSAPSDFRPVVMEDKRKVPVSDWVTSDDGRVKMEKFWKYMER